MYVPSLQARCLVKRAEVSSLWRTSSPLRTSPMMRLWTRIFCVMPHKAGSSVHFQTVAIWKRSPAGQTNVMTAEQTVLTAGLCYAIAWLVDIFPLWAHIKHIKILHGPHVSSVALAGQLPIQSNALSWLDNSALSHQLHHSHNSILTLLKLERIGFKHRICSELTTVPYCSFLPPMHHYPHPYKELLCHNT